MTDDLIARLRWWGEHGVSGSLNDLVEAADRIEELESWKAAEEAHHHMLRAEAAENARIIGMSAEREMALRGEVERLRTALRFYAAWGVFAPSHDDAVILDSGGAARAALEGTSHDD